MLFTIRFYVSSRCCKRLAETSQLFPLPTSISLSSAFLLPSFSSLFSVLTSSAQSAKSNNNCVLCKRIKCIIYDTFFAFSFFDIRF